MNKESYPGEHSTGIFSPERRSVLLIFIATFFFWAAIYFYAPVLPVYAESLGASLTTVGIIGAAYALPQLLFRIPAGMWSDSLGRRKPLVIGGLVMVLLGALGLWISPNPWALSVSRGIVGIGTSTWVVFTIYAVSLFPEHKTTQAVGMLNFIVGAAMTITTALGGLAADIWGERTAFLTSAVIAAVAIVFVLPAKEVRIPKTLGLSWEGLTQVMRRPFLIVVSIMGICLFFAEFMSVWGFVPVYAARIGASDTELGILTMLVSGISMAGALVVAPMVNRWGNIFTLVLGFVTLGLSLLAVPFIHSLPLLYAVQSLNGVGWGMLPTQLMALSIQNTAPHQRATAMGFFQAMYAIGMLLGPLVSGFLADNFGLAVIFYFASAVCLLGIGMAYPLSVLQRRFPEKD